MLLRDPGITTMRMCGCMQSNISGGTHIPNQALLFGSILLIRPMKLVWLWMAIMLSTTSTVSTAFVGSAGSLAFWTHPSPLGECRNRVGQEEHRDGSEQLLHPRDHRSSGGLHGLWLHPASLLSVELRYQGLVQGLSQGHVWSPQGWFNVVLVPQTLNSHSLKISRLSLPLYFQQQKLIY